VDKQQGKKNFDRGRNFEYRIVYRARKRGLNSYRIVLSGAGEEKGDIVIEDRKYECKYRSDDSGLKTLYNWFTKAQKEGCEGVIFKVKGHKKDLIVLDVDDYLSVLEERKINKNGLTLE
jgi:transposase